MKLGIRIEIKEIENGFVVELFTEHGISKLDKTVFASTMKNVLDIIKVWVRAERKEGDKQE